MEGVQGFTAGSESLFVAGANCPQVRPNTVTTDANGKPLIWPCSLVKMATPAEYACSDRFGVSKFLAGALKYLHCLRGDIGSGARSWLW